MKLKRKPSFLPLIIYNQIFVEYKEFVCVLINHLKNQFEYQISAKTVLPVIAEDFGLFHLAN